MFIKKIWYFLLIIFISSTAYAENINIERLVNAVWYAEGGSKADYLYGIRSVKYKDADDARRICRNSVKNNIARWHKAGCPKDFFSYMGQRYCPPTAHKNNQFWVKNVRRFYEIQKR